jgi:hypothetical protein
MNNKKNIDRLFQEKFKDFEVAPNDAVWNRISESLPNKKKKRRIIALWWQIGGVAAVIALLLTVGVSVFNSDDINNEELPIVNIENEDDSTKDKNTNSSADDKKDVLNGNKIEKLKLVDSNEKSILDKKEKSNLTTPEKTKVSNKLIITNKNQSNAVVTNSEKNQKPPASQKPNTLLNTVINNDNKTMIAENTNTTQKQLEETKLATESEVKSTIKKTIDNNKTATVDKSIKTESEVTKSTNVENTDVKNSILENPKKESIIDAVADNKVEVIDEKEDEQNRWSIAPNVAPVYYSSLGKGSSLDQQFNDNTKSSPINMSYGIAGAYAVSKKFKIRAGINRVNLSQTTSDVFAFTGPEVASRGTSVEQPTGNITYNSDVQNVLLMSSSMLDLSSAPEIFNTKIAGDVDQRIGFIEVPLELEYSVLDKKFGINVIGGFSTFILNENKIYADIDGTNTLIGESNNINNTSFSANFGLGLDYDLSKKWQLNLEPTFKYQLNTFNNTSGNFNPFFVAVYTGLSFKF